MFDTTNIATPNEVFDSLSGWLYTESKKLDVREREIFRMPPGEERDHLLFDLQNEYEVILEARKNLQSRREAAVKELL